MGIVRMALTVERMALRKERMVLRMELVALMVLRADPMALMRMERMALMVLRMELVALMVLRADLMALIRMELMALMALEMELMVLGNPVLEKMVLREKIQKMKEDKVQWIPMEAMGMVEMETAKKLQSLETLMLMS